jgi:hypothetical protein
MHTGLSYKRENNPLYPPFLRGNSDDGPLLRGILVIAGIYGICPLVFAEKPIPISFVEGNSVVFPLIRGNTAATSYPNIL